MCSQLFFPNSRLSFVSLCETLITPIPFIISCAAPSLAKFIFKLYTLVAIIIRLILLVIPSPAEAMRQVIVTCACVFVKTGL